MKRSSTACLAIRSTSTIFSDREAHPADVRRAVELRVRGWLSLTLGRRGMLRRTIQHLPESDWRWWLPSLRGAKRATAALWRRTPDTKQIAEVVHRFAGR
jgi:hypothetical protein